VFSLGLNTRSIDVGDVDGDGTPDVVAAFQFSDHLVWFTNTDGQGGFSTGTVIDTSVGGVTGVKLADIDGDGDLDVVSTFKDGDRVAWYENSDGKGAFASGRALSTTADGAYALAVADLDGDGDADVVTACVYDGLAWYENSNGGGAFSLGISLEPAEPAGAKDVVTADIDGDGDFDIISASFDGSHSDGDFPDGRLIWIENTDGAGTFGDGKAIDSLDSARSVVAVDLDNDGDADLVACDNLGGLVVWYENTDGQGSFSAAIDIALDPGVNMLIAVDLDGDGDFDLVTVNRDDARVNWYENLLEGDDDSGTTPAPLLDPTPVPDPSGTTPTPLLVPAPTPGPSAPIDRTPAPIPA
ncbi:unnamed protein product, partial [Ectocarpus sp. 8 AP-2014]